MATKSNDSGSGEDQVQAKFDEADEKGYFGYSPDETPRENYTLQTPPDAEVPEVKARNDAAKARKEQAARRLV